MAIEMRCPGCGMRSFYSRTREPDDSLRCVTCRREFEFRQFRESACRSHRDELLHACPELARAFSTEDLDAPWLGAQSPDTIRFDADAVPPRSKLG